jgi:hypothetical protein
LHWKRGDLGHPIGRGRVSLAGDPVPERAPEENVRAAVLERFVLHDPARAAHLEDGRPARVIRGTRGIQELDAEEPFARERVREHGLIAGFEDVEGEDRLRKEEDVREREEREKDGCGHGRDNDADK